MKLGLGQAGQKLLHLAGSRACYRNDQIRLCRHPSRYAADSWLNLKLLSLSWLKHVPAVAALASIELHRTLF